MEALEVLNHKSIDLVLIDINMPVMDGIEMIDVMLDDDLLQNIPVIVISTEGSTTRIRQMERKGIRAYIRKPFSPEIIRDSVESVLGYQNAERI
jgi:two-component system chemotaxis response regulator CheY